MVIRNHIAYRFLTDDVLWIQLLETWHPEEIKAFYAGKIKELSGSVHALYDLLRAEDSKTYLVSSTVTENFDMFKVKKQGHGHFDWTVFKNLPEGKTTFILPDNRVLRMRIIEDRMHFCFLTFTPRENKFQGWTDWVVFYLNRETGELCEHFEHPDVATKEEFIYKLLCFFYLTENDEVVVPAGKVYGTRKAGKISNDFSFPLTMVTARWNTTTIRTEKFGVRGHFRVQPCGKGRMNYEIIFIEPFEKKGYTRRAGKLTQ